MNLTTSFADRIRSVFQPTERGVVGLADDLLILCRDQQLQFDFQDGHCHVRPLGVAPHDAVDVPLPKSVFRAVLARIAALCNEQRPDSVTPYRGEGELLIRTDPPAAFHVAFRNTPAEQRLEVKPATTSNGESTPSRGHEEARQVLVELAFRALAEAGVSDPDVLLWDSLIRGDADSLQAALAAGADPHVTEGEVIRRHAGSLVKPPVSDLLATAALVRILIPQANT